MLSTIIDNSTLTAVQRLTGKIPVAKSYDVEGDVSAFENFLTALLFHDNLFYVDDYKTEHRQGRAEEFFYLKPLRSDDSVYANLEGLARSLSSDLMLTVSGVEVEANEIGKLLSQMGLHLTAAWTMTSSEWFLNLRVLTDDPGRDAKYKYSKLTAAIFQQVSHLSDQSEGRTKLVSSAGELIEDILADRKDHHLSGELRAFASSLNWLSLRTLFYFLYANHLESTFTLHPIRHSFLVNFLSDRGITRGPSLPQNMVAFFGQKSVETVERINREVEDGSIVHSLPWMSGWLVGTAKTPSLAIKKALELREEPSLVNVRRRLSDIAHLQQGPDPRSYKREVMKLKADVASTLTRYITVMGGSVGQESRSLQASLGLEGLKFELSLNLLEGAKSLISRNRKVTGLLRNIVNDVVGYQDLSHVRGLLRSEIRREQMPSTPILETEQSHYRHARLHWKRPF